MWWGETGGQPDNRTFFFDDIVRRYRERWRKYHALPHIGDMYADFDVFRRSDEICFVDVPVVEGGIWYHDAVCYPGAHDNEEQSAKVFRVIGETSGFPDVFIRKVNHAILATKHLETPDDWNACVLCDLDLAILGKPPAVFDRYEANIWLEYKGIAAEDRFRAVRAGVLRQFAERDRIYTTAFFEKKYGAQARENLARSIQQLSRR